MTNLIGQSLGRYHILEQLGEGGMATVYKAFDTRLEADVAVKVIRTENLPQSGVERALKRFEREAKALAKLTHANIVKVIDYGEYEAKPYLVMPFLPGGTLKQRLQGKPMPWHDAVYLLLPIARALSYAHKQGMIHRDVKPSNILITEAGDPMLTDFGIAKIIDEESTVDLTGTNATVGTPEYMAPEQVTSKSVDARVDIYALGVVLYEMITGRKPFRADTPMAVLFKHANEPLPPPKQFVHDLPEAVEKALIKALAKKPEDRYQTMGEFASALEILFDNAVEKGKDQTLISTEKSTTIPDRKPIESGLRSTTDLDRTQDEGVAGEKHALPEDVSVSSQINKGKATDIRPQATVQKQSGHRNLVGIAIVSIILLMCMILGGGTILMGEMLRGLIPPTATSTPTHTETPTPTETPTITPTFTPSMTPTQSYLDWPVVLTEPFDDNINNWFVGPSKDTFLDSSVSITDGQYIVDITALQGVFWALTPTVKNLDNFYLSVEVENKTGPASSDYGLAFRISSGNKYYFAIAAEDQVYSFMVLNNNQWTTIIDWTSSSQINNSGSNQVAVLAKGTSYSFFINGELVNQAEDSTLKSGEVGVAVTLSKAGDTGQFAFDNFEVRAPNAGE